MMQSSRSLGKLSALAFAVSAAFVGSAQAQESTQATSVKAQDVLVTASRVQKPLADVNMSVSVITGEEIARNAQAKTIADLLESSVPGIRVMNDGSQGIDRISIRGEDAFRTVVMVNGQRISEQKSMSGVPLLIDPSQVERIEVIRGPASVLYGSDAIGGAINIITKKGGEDAFGGTVSAGYDTASDGKDLAASLAGTSGGWNWRIGAALRDHGELDTPRGKAEHSEFKSKSADAFLSYDISDTAQIGASISHHDLEFMAGDMSQKPENFWVNVPEWTRTRAALFSEVTQVTDHLARIRTDLSFERNDKKMNNHVAPSPFAPVITSLADNTLDTIAFSVQADWALTPSHFLITGYEFGHDSLDSTSVTKLQPPGMPFPFTSKDHTYDGTQTRHAIFASMESILTDNLTANYGVRYTYVENDMDIHAKQGWDIMQTPGGMRPVRVPAFDKSDEQSKGKAVFNAGLTYKATDEMTLRANYSQGYRSPILQELFIDTTMGGQDTRANKDLKPETSDTFEVGARYQNDALTVDAALFYSKADDYIARVDMGEYSQYQNMSEAQTYGLELQASYRAGHYEPYAIVTLMDRTYTQNGIESSKSGTPKLSARYGVRMNCQAQGMAFDADVYAVSQTKSESWDFSANRLSARYDAFTTFNATAGMSFGPKGAYRLDAGVYNITDKAYQTNAAIWEAGRHAAVKFNAVF